jgi:hypothetical protein
LDSTDPQAVQMVRDTHPLPTTLFIVATKSGGTAETLSFFKYFYNVYLETMDADEAGQHFIAITDPGSKLALLAENLNFRRTFMNNPDIGGRFSVLSYFGMVPAALMGVDIEELLVGAQKMMDRCSSAYVEENNPAVQLGGMLGGLTLQKINKVTFLSSQGLAPFGDWVEQLIAESTGKEGKGLLPVVNEPVGRIEEYSTDRIFVTQHLISESVDYGFVTNLEKNGFPCIDIVLDDLYDLGALFFLWEMATALVGYCLSIQPFDQPNVEMAKHLARESMAHYFKTGELEQVPYAALTPVSLEQFLSNVRMGDYVALQAYVAPANEVDSALTELQLTIRKKYHIPVTRGYGPRFLHSTGQLHKGDDGSGLFIQLVSSSEVDLCIPDEPGNPKSSITFGILKTAQAMGDYKALHDAGRRVIRFQVKGNSPAGIRKLLPVTNQSNKKV